MHPAVVAILMPFLPFLMQASVPAAAQPPPADLASIDSDAMSGDPDRIRRAIDAYGALDGNDPEVQWRRIRAYFNYYDELAERGRRADREWAVENGYPLAERAYRNRPDKVEIAYYYASIGLCYLDFHRTKVFSLIPRILDAFKTSLALDPSIDDAGPDRNLGILYHELPWFYHGNSRKALEHLAQAARRSPTRAANRLPLAMVLAERGLYEQGWPHIEFVRAGNFKVSSPHWRAIYMRRVEEVAGEFPSKDGSSPP